ncbi:MAG: hypothetical protein Q8L27_02150, partial [archaeon]|nr:hypothetical protein [archaeon]
TTTGNTTCTTTKGVVSSTTSTASTITDTGLACGSEFDYTLTCYDLVGNSNSTHIAVSTASCSDASTGGTGGSSGSSGSGTTTWTQTYVVDNTLFSGGETYTRALSANNRIKFTAGKAEHTVGVLEVGTTSAKIQVASTPQEATINVGETKKFDVTGDSYYDVQVTLNSITAGKADLSIKSINEAVPAGAETATGGEEGTTTGDETAGETAKSSKTLWIILGAIVIAAVIAWFVMFRRK